MPKAISPFVGKKIKTVRFMTAKELEHEGWSGNRPPIVIVLTDGSKIFPSSDDEGNGPGCMFGSTPDGTSVYVA
jgi:hypothetical protein